jgi:hypothetical protein
MDDLHSAKRSRATFTLVLLALVVVSAGASQPSDVRSGTGISETVVELLKKGAFEQVAQIHHYPPSYSPKEREEDAKAVARSLRFLFGRSGTVSDVQPLRREAEFYFVSVSGGDAPYWESISPYPLSEHPYRVQFSNLGPAMVNIVVLETGPKAGRELVSIQLGLSVESPGSKEKLVNLSLDMLKEMDVPTPPNVKDLIEQGMNRAIVVPADIAE